MVSKSSVSKSGWANFWHALIAVVAGNAVYFLVMPHLPFAAQHRAFQMDLGMVVDFWFCLVALAIVKTTAWWRREGKLRKHSGGQ